jgi:hypothetical protein
VIKNISLYYFDYTYRKDPGDCTVNLSSGIMSFFVFFFFVVNFLLCSFFLDLVWSISNEFIRVQFSSGVFWHPITHANTPHGSFVRENRTPKPPNFDYHLMRAAVARFAHRSKERKKERKTSKRVQQENLHLNHSNRQFRLNFMSLEVSHLTIQSWRSCLVVLAIVVAVSGRTGSFQSEWKRKKKKMGKK